MCSVWEQIPGAFRPNSQFIRYIFECNERIRANVIRRFVKHSSSNRPSPKLRSRLLLGSVRECILNAPGGNRSFVLNPKFHLCQHHCLCLSSRLFSVQFTLLSFRTTYRVKSSEVKKPTTETESPLDLAAQHLPFGC